MSAIDPFARDDAAYVLGVLPDADRAAFEAHLTGCADCRARVRELQDVPRLLSGIAAADLDEHIDAAEPPPDTLLPGLLRAASARRRRTRAAVTALGAVAAACVIALVVTLWPTTSQPAAKPTPARFVALVSEPISADAVLTAKKWGTEIDLKCVYSAAITSTKRFPYMMYAYDAEGDRYSAGSWNQGQEVKFVGGTWLNLDEISKIEITLPNGKPILRLYI